LFALSLTFNVPVRVPVAPGLKVTEIVQWELAARLVPHPFVWAKSVGFAPVNVMLPIVNAVRRLLVSVTLMAPLVVPTVCAANVREVGETVACEMPVPVKVACGLFVDGLLTVRVAVSAVRVVGVKVTVMTQDFAAGTLVPHVLVWLKSPAFAPLKLMLEMLSACASLL
jgi:hypothetical protein